jgi:high affinity sulfate transporter 1
MHARRPTFSYGDAVISLKGYGANDARADVVAGVVLTALAVPAGMGYAEAAGLPAVTGLYATIVALVAYALVGPSSILVIAPDSSLAPIIASAVLPLSGGDPDRAIALAGMLAILSGVVLLIGGIVRLGFVADLLSKPIRLGYLAGIAVVILTSQLPKLFGFSSVSDDPLPRMRDFVEDLIDGATDGQALALGVLALALAAGLRWRVPRAPAFLIAIVVPALLVWLLDLSDDVPVVGRLDQGLPAPALDAAQWGDFRELLPAAAGLALVVFADSGILSRTFSLRRGERVDENSEMRAVGITNIATGVLGGFPVAASSSRTPAAEAAGARTQVTALASAAMTALLLLAAPGATEVVPSSALAAVVIVAAAGLVEPAAFVHLARVRFSEFAFALAAFLGVVVLGVLEGIGVAVALALLAFIARAWRPYATELVRVDRRKGYHDIGRHPTGRRVPGLVLARFDAPLFFANGARFEGFVRGLVDSAPGDVRWVVVAAEPITDVDSTAADELVELDDHLRARGIQLAFAEMKGPVKDRLARYGISDRFRQFPTVGTAVDAYVEATGTVWVDWEERGELEEQGDDGEQDHRGDLGDEDERGEPGDTPPPRDQDGRTPPVA